MTNLYLLDTDVCVFLLRGRAHTVAQRLRDLRADQVGTTAITAAELWYGALRSAKSDDNLSRVQQFLAPIVRVPFDNRAAAHFARIKAALAAEGQLIGPMDLLIAATALSVNATLVTNNGGEYRRVPGLRIENWM